MGRQHYLFTKGLLVYIGTVARFSRNKSLLISFGAPVLNRTMKNVEIIKAIITHTCTQACTHARTPTHQHTHTQTHTLGKGFDFCKNDF